MRHGREGAVPHDANTINASRERRHRPRRRSGGGVCVVVCLVCWVPQLVPADGQRRGRPSLLRWRGDTRRLRLWLLRQLRLRDIQRRHRRSECRQRRCTGRLQALQQRLPWMLLVLLVLLVVLLLQYGVQSRTRAHRHRHGVCLQGLPLGQRRLPLQLHLPRRRRALGRRREPRGGALARALREHLAVLALNLHLALVLDRQPPAPTRRTLPRALRRRARLSSSDAWLSSLSPVAAAQGAATLPAAAAAAVALAAAALAAAAAVLAAAAAALAPWPCARGRARVRVGVRVGVGRRRGAPGSPAATGAGATAASGPASGAA
mmetsp:Transcript_34342/g.113663  ORF Transcript_34342/g.113663 Transcript_34342/m.113663 type:complete len:320 (-) Transcript_34342:1030-1989(-)